MAKPKQPHPDDELLRKRVAEILLDTNPWDGYEDRREWLEGLLRRPADYVFTPAQHAGVNRIKVARTPYEGWDGLRVQELAKAAKQYAADFSEPEDEALVDDILARRATRLSWSDMRRLVGLCRDVARMDVAKFNPLNDGAFVDAERSPLVSLLDAMRNATRQKVFIRESDPEWPLWQAHLRRTIGRGSPINRQFGWYFPTRLPPDESTSELRRLGRA
jgi:hypothetical protein